MRRIIIISVKFRACRPVSFRRCIYIRPIGKAHRTSVDIETIANIYLYCPTVCISFFVVFCVLLHSRVLVTQPIYLQKFVLKTLMLTKHTAADSVTILYSFHFLCSLLQCTDSRLSKTML